MDAPGDEKEVNASATSSLTQPTEFHWGRPQVLSLISNVEEFFEDFYDGTKKKKTIWNAVAEHMRKEGHNCTGNDCDKKWRNLKATYIRVLQKQLHGDTSSRFEYFDALHHILGQEIDPLGMREQALSQGMVGVSESIVPEVFHEITEDEGFLWTDDAVNLLLDCISQYKESFSSPSTLSTVWEDIAGNMSLVGQEVRSHQCQRKWLDLQEGLKFHQAHAEATGTVPLWAFYTRTRELFNIINSQSTSLQGEFKLRSSDHEDLGQGVQAESSPLGLGKAREGRGRSVLSRVKNIESSLSIKKRLERLEARVESSRQQREASRKTNVLLVQVLAELRRINTALKQEETLHRSIRATAGPQEAGPCSPSQEFIIVEACTDHQL